MRAVFRFATTRALAGGGRIATAISIIGLVFKIARKLSGNEPKTLYTHELKPGEALMVSDVLAKK